MNIINKGMMMRIKKYYKQGTLPLKSIEFDHIIPRVARKSPSGQVCRISLPRELDGKQVYVIAALRNLGKPRGK